MRCVYNCRLASRPTGFLIRYKIRQRTEIFVLQPLVETIQQIHHNISRLPETTCCHYWSWEKNNRQQFGQVSALFHFDTRVGRGWAATLATWTYIRACSFMAVDFSNCDGEFENRISIACIRNTNTSLPNYSSKLLHSKNK